MNLTTSQSDRLSSIGCVRQIAGETNNFPDIEKTMKRDTCIFVKKCLNKELCSNFDNYFDIIKHNKRTKQGFPLRLPVIKLESTKNSFFFTGVKLFNSLSNTIKISRRLQFYEKVKGIVSYLLLTFPYLFLIYSFCFLFLG